MLEASKANNDTAACLVSFMTFTVAPDLMGTINAITIINLDMLPLKCFQLC